MRIYIIIIALLLGASSIQAGHKIKNQVISFGGGASSNSAFTMQNTVGQAVIGISENGSYSLNHGFWISGAGTYYLPKIECSDFTADNLFKLQLQNFGNCGCEIDALLYTPEPKKFLSFEYIDPQGKWLEETDFHLTYNAGEGRMTFIINSNFVFEKDAPFFSDIINVINIKIIDRDQEGNPYISGLQLDGEPVFTVQNDCNQWIISDGCLIDGFTLSGKIHLEGNFNCTRSIIEIGAAYDATYETCPASEQTPDDGIVAVKPNYGSYANNYKKPCNESGYSPVDGDQAEYTPVYPNPTTGNASFTLKIKEDQRVRIAVHDILGKQVLAIYDGMMKGARLYDIDVNAGHLPHGIYMLRLSGESFNIQEQLVIVR